MAEAVSEDMKKSGPGMKMFFFIGMLLAAVGGGAGYYAVHSGMVFAGESASPAGPPRQGLPPTSVGTATDIEYVPIEPLVISLGDGLSGRHLRFRAELEVFPEHRPDVERVMPRIVDVLNSYLRALKVEDVADSSALLRMRAQMLRRVQVVTGGTGINDLLIMEFILN